MHRKNPVASSEGRLTRVPPEACGDAHKILISSQLEDLKCIIISYKFFRFLFFEVMGQLLEYVVLLGHID